MATTDTIEKYITESAKAQGKKYRELKTKYDEQFNVTIPYVGDITAPIVCDDMPLDMKLRNLMASMSNNIVAGLRYESEAIALHGKVKKEKNLKRAAFLFILKLGLAGEFQDFLASYRGDMENDIRKGAASHFKI